jgi:branched-chain amino acid transport system ATP-binding protein
MNILEVDKLSAGYGKSQVLFDVSLKVEEKSMCAIMGPNGSGKSTLLKTIFGLTDVYGGSIKFGERSLVGEKPHKIAKLGIAYLRQQENVYLNLKVRENLTMAAYILSKEETDKRMSYVLEIFPELIGFLERKVSTMSGGERQMLIMAMALIREPSLMMLDEPSANLSPKITEKVFQRIVELNRDLGVTVLLVEQNTKMGLEVSDETYLLVSGRVNYHAKSTDLAANKELGRLFLGL